MAQITKKNLSEIEAEYAKWGEFLNGGIGILAFSFGISCLGTPRPDVSAFFSLAFLLLILLYGKKHFPEKLRELRKADLAGVDQVALIGIEKKYFGFLAVIKNFSPYLTGWLFLGGVSIYGLIRHNG